MRNARVRSSLSGLGILTSLKKHVGIDVMSIDLARLSVGRKETGVAFIAPHANVPQGYKYVLYIYMWSLGTGDFTLQESV